jgi:hypothetical protein
VIEALGPLAQPDLLETTTTAAVLLPSGRQTASINTSSVVAPIPTLF